MKRFNEYRYLNLKKLANFLLVDSDFRQENSWLEFIAPILGDLDSSNTFLHLSDNTLYDLATVIYKNFSDFSHHLILDSCGYDDEKSVLCLMGWIAQDCCTYEFAFNSEV